MGKFPGANKICPKGAMGELVHGQVPWGKFKLAKNQKCYFEGTGLENFALFSML